MKITKSQLKRIIKEELERSTVQGQRAKRQQRSEREKITRPVMDPAIGTQAAIQTAKPVQKEAMPDTTSKIHTNPKLAGQPASWLKMADRLKQMSRVWVDPEDGKMLELAGAILRSAFDQHSAESDAALGMPQG